MRACCEPVVELADHGGRALALALDDLDLRAQVEDPTLEGVLLGLQLVGGLDQRRPFLGRVADTRTLGGELGGDEEPEREQGDPERDLPGRDGAQSPDRDHGGGGAARRRRTASAAATSRTIAPTATRMPTTVAPSSAAGPPAAPGTGVAVDAARGAGRGTLARRRSRRLRRAPHRSTPTAPAPVAPAAARTWSSGSR